MNKSLITQLLDRLPFTLGLPPVMLLALGARLLGIASRPIWYDEAFSILFSEKGFRAMLVGTLSTIGTRAAEEHPLLYYFLLSTWMRAFGESLVAVRALSIAAGLLLVLVVYFLTQALFGSRAAIGAGLIVALSPFQVHYSQEIRMYVFLALWLLLATYAYWRASQGGDLRWWLAFAVCAALAEYTHNLAAFYLLALALWPLLRRDWQVVRSVLFSGVVALLLYLPWLVNLPSQFSKVDQGYWIERPGLSRLFTLLLVFATNTPLLGWELAAGLFIAIFVVLIGLRQTISAARRHQPGAMIASWLLYLAFAPPLLLFVFSQWKPIYIERALLPSGAIFCIWLAWVLTESRLLRPVQVFVVLLLALGFGIGLFEHVAYGGFPYAPYATLDRYLESARQGGDVIIHSNKISMLPTAYYDRRLPETYIGDPPGSGEDTLAISTQRVLGLEAQPNVRAAAGSASRIWFVISDRSNREFIDAGDAGHPDLLWLQQHYSQLDISTWGDLRLYLFSREP